jgi:hypothetical protein
MPFIQAVAASIVLLAAPALAGLQKPAAKSFYVLRDSSIGVCEISTVKPRTWGRTVIGDLAFDDEGAAQSLARQYCASVLSVRPAP